MVYKKEFLRKKIFIMIKMSSGCDYGENDDTRGGEIDLDSPTEFV